ncbi:hypothetical protein CVT24_012978 [Panaeolus cyanescens]|uniref:Uncharacterized protein n=1 Tax=Panaeolus cyanescens TaxID=181874 RepID=A0A409WQY3_9AGAR|nr:hypothetical protein CVT24_012978 [Panaeolus cyanescens]
MAHLDGLDVKRSVDDFLGKSTDHEVLGFSSSLRAMNNAGQTGLINNILGTITDAAFRKTMMDTFAVHIREHPFETAIFLVGVVLSSIPNLIMMGFGIFSTIKAASSIIQMWKASSGGINAATNALILLHGSHLLLKVVLPVAGAAANEVGKWGSGQYGTPVQNWARGDYGRPVEQWWNGDFGNPVSNWFGSMFR